MIFFEWGPAGIEAYAHHVEAVVIVDVLSFSTAASVAVDRGAEVLPYAYDYKLAAAFARKCNAMLAVHRRDASDGNPYSLSPASLTNIPAKTRLVLPSPNGSACCIRARELGIEHIFIGSLRNASATANALAETADAILVTACGERWPDDRLRPAVEDYLGAGAVLHRLRGKLTPEAHVAAAAYSACKPTLSDTIANSLSGIELIAAGYAYDVELAVAEDASQTAAEMFGDEIRAAKAVRR